MLIFRRIFNFQKEKVEQIEQRLNRRYTPGASFPLQIQLSVARYSWRPTRVLNISGNGLGLVIGKEAKVSVGQPVRMLLTLDHHKLELDGVLAHFQQEPAGLVCGIAMNHADFQMRKAYLQLLQPIVIGQSLQPVAAELVIQNEPQFIKQVYRGDSDSALTVWLEMALGTPLHSFEFRMSDYFCRAAMATGVLEAYLLESADSHVAKLSNPVFDTSGALRDEIRQLFRWIVPNLGPAIPDDVRAFLQKFAG